MLTESLLMRSRFLTRISILSSSTVCLKVTICLRTAIPISSSPRWARRLSTTCSPRSTLTNSATACAISQPKTARSSASRMPSSVCRWWSRSVLPKTRTAPNGWCFRLYPLHLPTCVLSCRLTADVSPRATLTTSTAASSYVTTVLNAS